MKKTLIAGGLLVAALLILVFGRGVDPQEYTVGFVLPVTGDAAAYGESAQNAAALAVKRLKGEGLPIRPLFEDSQFSSELAAGAAHKLIQAGGVDAIVTFSSGETLAICPITESAGILLFSEGSSPEITSCGLHTFRNYPSDIYQGNVLADKVQELGYDKVALVYLNNDYGLGLKNEFIKNNTAHIVVEESMALGYTDFRTSIAKVKQSGADGLVLIANPLEAGVFLAQSVELGLEIDVLASEALKDDSVLDMIPLAAQARLQVIAASEYAGTESTAFYAEYEAVYGAKPALFADYVYDNVIVFGKALEECRSGNQQCLRSALHALTHVGATGEISFDQNGDVQDKSYDLFVPREGSFVKQYLDSTDSQSSPPK